MSTLSTTTRTTRSSTRARRPVIPHHVPDILYLPRTMDSWPWQEAINPHHAAAKKDSDDWFFSFSPFTPQSRNAFERCDFARLASQCAPNVSKAQLRVGCDLITLTYLIDEYTDHQPTDVVRETCAIIQDALLNPWKERPEHELLVGQLTKEFWLRAIECSTASGRRPFLRTFMMYLDSVIDQAEDRVTNHLRSIDDFIDLRRNNTGVRPCLFIGTMHLDISDAIRGHRFLIELENMTCDFILLENDLLSFNREQATGNDQCNIITTLMHQLNVDYLGAVEWLAEHHKTLQSQFLALIGNLPQRLRDDGVAVDDHTAAQLAMFIDHLGQWVRANEAWSFESQRYFGVYGGTIRETRLVRRLPQKHAPTMAGQPQKLVAVLIPGVQGTLE